MENFLLITGLFFTGRGRRNTQAFAWSDPTPRNPVVQENPMIKQGVFARSRTFFFPKLIRPSYFFWRGWPPCISLSGVRAGWTWGYLPALSRGTVVTGPCRRQVSVSTRICTIY